MTDWPAPLSRCCGAVFSAIASRPSSGAAHDRGRHADGPRWSLRIGGTIPKKASQFYEHQLSHFFSKSLILFNGSSPLPRLCSKVVLGSPFQHKITDLSHG